MIACVSPADVNLEESVNTLRYASRARNITNTLTANKDEASAEVAYLRRQLALAKNEIATLRSIIRLSHLDGVAPMKAAPALGQIDGGAGDARPFTAPGDGDGDARRDPLALVGRSVELPPSSVLAGSHTSQDSGTSGASDASDVTADGESADLDPDMLHEERNHALKQRRLHTQVQALEVALPEKEAAMNRVLAGSGQMAALKAHYDRAFVQMEQEIQDLNAEKLRMVGQLQSKGRKGKAGGGGGGVRSDAAHRHNVAKVKALEAKIKELKQKQTSLGRLERLKAKSDTACERLKGQIESIKHQKASLVRQMQKSAKDFECYRRQKRKEVCQLTRERQRAASDKQRLECLSSKQQAVVKRKTEEAAAANRRLKEVMHRSASARLRRTKSDNTGAGVDGVPECQPNALAPLLRDEKSRQLWIQNEIEACTASEKIRTKIALEISKRQQVSHELQESQAKMQELEKKLKIECVVSSLNAPKPHPPAHVPPSTSQHPNTWLVPYASCSSLRALLTRPFLSFLRCNAACPARSTTLTAASRGATPLSSIPSGTPRTSCARHASA